MATIERREDLIDDGDRLVDRIAELRAAQKALIAENLRLRLMLDELQRENRQLRASSPASMTDAQRIQRVRSTLRYWSSLNP
jgi:hypothetical protein